MQYINTIISVFALAGLVASHSSFDPKSSKPNTNVDVILKLFHSCEYKDGETWKVSNTNKVMIYYPEELVKNNLLVNAKPFKNSKKTEFKQIPEPISGTEVSHDHHDHEHHHHDHEHHHHDHGHHDHDHHDHDHDHEHHHHIHRRQEATKSYDHDHHGHDHDHDHDHHDHAHHRHDHQDHDHHDHDHHGHDHHDHDHHDHDHHDHDHHTHDHRLHRRQAVTESPSLGVTYENFSEESLSINLSFKTPKLDQISGDKKAIYFKVDQFCENGQTIRSIVGDSEHPPVEFKITL